DSESLKIRIILIHVTDARRGDYIVVRSERFSSYRPPFPTAPSESRLAIASRAYTHLLALRLETLTRLYRELQQLRCRVRGADASRRRRRPSGGPMRRL